MLRQRNVARIDGFGNVFFLAEVPKIVAKIDPGIYEIGLSPQDGPFLRPRTINHEPIIITPNSVVHEIKKHVENFTSAAVREAYKRYDVTYKTGILLHGKPGTGKSYTIYDLLKHLTEQQWITLLDPPVYQLHTVLQSIRAINGPETCVCVVWEELDAILRLGEDTQRRMQQLLDGAEGADNVIFIATTNHFDELPEELTIRPGRFPFIREVSPPDERTRRNFFENKLHDADKAKYLEIFTTATKGLVLDYCKQLIVDVIVNQVPLDRAIMGYRAASKLATFPKKDHPLSKLLLCDIVDNETGEICED